PRQEPSKTKRGRARDVPPPAPSREPQEAPCALFSPRPSVARLGPRASSAVALAGGLRTLVHRRPTPALGRPSGRLSHGQLRPPLVRAPRLWIPLRPPSSGPGHHVAPLTRRIFGRGDGRKSGQDARS